MSKTLLQEVGDATGLPSDLIQNELKELVAKQGYAPSEVTLDQLRLALAEYMRQVLLEIHDETQDGVWVDEYET